MTTYTFPTPPDDLTTIFDRNDREWRRTPGGWQRQHNSFDAAVLPWKTLLINYGPLTTTDLTDTSELPDTTDSNSDARRIAELEQQITDHTRICRILENAQAQQHRDDAYTLHQPVERYQDSPDSDLSFDTATAAADHGEIPITQVTHFLVCETCGALETGFDPDTALVRDYKHSLWPCATALALYPHGTDDTDPDNTPDQETPTTMTTTHLPTGDELVTALTTLEQHVRDIADEQPDFRYTKIPLGDNHRDVAADLGGCYNWIPKDPANYTLPMAQINELPAADRCPSCIIGQALARYGVPLDTLAIDTLAYTSITRMLLPPTASHTEHIATFADPRLGRAMIWFTAVQRHQDDGNTWADAVTAADEQRAAYDSNPEYTTNPIAFTPEGHTK